MIYKALVGFTSFGYVISSTNNIVFEFKALITEIEWCNTSDTFTSWSNGTPASRRVGDGSEIDPKFMSSSSPKLC